MTYEEIVQLVRETYESADAREIFEHIAVQVNMTGEGGGIFYLEVAERAISVEPYDYVDRDGLLTLSTDTAIAVTKREIPFKEAVDSGLIRLEGNIEKIWQLSMIKPADKKHTAKKNSKKKSAKEEV